MNNQKENREYVKLVFDNRKYSNIIPYVSIVTPTYNRKKNLMNMLNSLTVQNYLFDKFEVIVVDDGSNDQTDKIIEQLSLPYRLKYFWQTDYGSRRARARNIGIQNARGEIIIFLDSDVLCNSELINEHLKFHKKSGNCVVMGLINDLNEGENLTLFELKNEKIIKKIRPKHLLWYFYMFFLEKIKKASLGLTICSMNASISKKHLIEIKGFDEDFDGMYGSEDMDLGYRLALNGLKIYWATGAIVYHQYHPKLEPIPLYNGKHRNELLLYLKHSEILKFYKIGIWRNKCYWKSLEDIKDLFSNIKKNESI